MRVSRHQLLQFTPLILLPLGQNQDRSQLSTRLPLNHTVYLSFLLHRQDFRKPNFTPKKTTKGTKNTKNVSEKVKYMHFFSLNLEKFTPDRKFLHRHVCGVCDKYQIWHDGSNVTGRP